MGITKPYYRIMRQTTARSVGYILDRRYSKDRFVLCHAYKIIEDDLKKILEFVEPANQNKAVYSHRLYELLLRSATEFETNCKLILSANGYGRSGNWNITDYHKINDATKLSKYEVSIMIWRFGEKILTPLEEWSRGHTLTWYQDYNLVKHDRYKNFKKASLINVVNAVAAVLAILFAQFHTYIFDQYQERDFFSEGDGFFYTENSLFAVKPFTSWSPNETYTFEWGTLEHSTRPFQRYPF